MKRLSAALVFGFLVVSLCFAQIQVGNASYNSSKAGFTISHPSLSFNTHVKVTNLGNNRFVEALVDYRIPITTERIADISREAGDALEMGKTGMTLVQIEVLPPRAVESAAAAQPSAAQPAPPSAAPSTITQVLPLQTVTELQYVPVPAAASVQPCCNAILMWVILLLLILVIAILVIILVLLHRRIPLWPWYYPLWIRRRRRYLKKTGRHLL
ncbi:MAG: hypothetical protein LBI67_04005 [Treponema sp.]|jgi:hypothetical protein|nr:hypothetical protein [Treponema sp.]